VGHSNYLIIEYSPFKKLLLLCSKKALKTEPFGGMPKRFAQTVFFGGISQICRQNLRFRRLFGISSLERNGEHRGGGAAPGHDDDVTDLTRAALLAPCPAADQGAFDSFFLGLFSFFLCLLFLRIAC